VKTPVSFATNHNQRQPSMKITDRIKLAFLREKSRKTPQKSMRALGLEPRTNGLKVRCESPVRQCFEWFLEIGSVFASWLIPLVLIAIAIIAVASRPHNTKCKPLATGEVYHPSINCARCHSEPIRVHVGPGTYQSGMPLFGD
jgi:hypothetical protein